MKLILLPLIFLAIYFANSSSFPSKLPQSACKVVSEVVKKENWTKTIAIVEFENKLESEVIDNLVKCLPSEIAVVIIDVNGFDTDDVNIHNPTFVVMIVDNPTRIILGDYFAYVADNFQTPLIKHYTKVLVLTTNQIPKSHDILKRALKLDSVLNVAIIFDTKNGVFVEFNGNEGAALALDKIEGDLIQKIYPDPTKDLKGGKQVIFVHEQPPKVQFEEEKIRGKMVHFLKAVTQAENSKLEFITFKNLGTSDPEKLRDYIFNLFIQRQAHITLNTLVKSGDIAPSLMTYEDTGICSVVPLPETNSMNFIFFKPFDLSIWLILIFTIACCMVVWRLGGHSTSIWYIPFFFFTFYHGQSVNFATNRKIFTVLLQILVFMLFILGNAYQGLITSYMMAPSEPAKLSSFDELLESDFKVIVSDSFDALMTDDAEYQSAVARGKINNSEAIFTFEDFDQIYKDRQAIMMDCEIAKYLVKSKYAPKFYVIKEKLFPYYEQLRASHTNKYLVRWQLMMDWSFEAGLMKVWEEFESEKKVVRSDDDEEETREILRFSDIAVVYYVLLLGLGAGLVVFLIEVFWGRCVKCFIKSRNAMRERKFGCLRRKVKHQIIMVKEKDA